MTEEYKIIDCQHKIISIAWKHRNPNYPADKNKFVIYTNEGHIQELTFYEKVYNVLDFSCKGEICISV